MSLQELINLIISNGYLLLFLAIVVEGPIFTVIAGFLSAMGVLDLYVSFFVALLGDLTGDIIYYSLGYFGKEKILLKFNKFFKLTLDKIGKVEKLFEKHPAKTLALGKISHGIGSLFLFAAGLAKVPFYKFLILDTIPSIPKSILLILIGFYFGESYNKINTYFDYAAIGTFFLFISLVIIYFLIKKIAKNIKD